MVVMRPSKCEALTCKYKQCHHIKAVGARWPQRHQCTRILFQRAVYLRSPQTPVQLLRNGQCDTDKKLGRRNTEDRLKEMVLVMSGIYSDNAAHPVIPTIPTLKVLLTKNEDKQCVERHHPEDMLLEKTHNDTFI